MIDIKETQAALERAIARADYIHNLNDATTLRALSAALGQAQEAWQLDTGRTVPVGVSMAEQRRVKGKLVLILPLIEPKTKEGE